jgi:hypothetical protein
MATMTNAKPKDVPSADCRSTDTRIANRWILLSESLILTALGISGWLLHTMLSGSDARSI